ncbi:MAG: hypothetical protein HQK64_00200 [Desulfamplus sp.]|nr:hypothetical protein [Desulfamplus sp.]MBF0388977.1 hypothetical protein [Desulfamplus sp.]
MADKTKKILLLDYNSEVTEQAMVMFEQFEVTTVAKLEDIAEQVKDEFDLIITGYLLPSLTNETLLAYLKDLQTAIAELKIELNANKTQDDVENELKAKHNEILELIVEQIELCENEKAEYDAKLANAEKTVKEAELKADKAQKEAKEFQAIAQAAEAKILELQSENAKIQSRLDKLQEQWENTMI